MYDKDGNQTEGISSSIEKIDMLRVFQDINAKLNKNKYVSDRRLDESHTELPLLHSRVNGEAYA